MISSLERHIGNYRLLEELGQGGMGTVYRAVHEESGIQVAIKTVRQLRTAHLNQIRREIHALLQLKHPGVVSIIEHGVIDNQPWYAMDFVSGVTLRQYQGDPESSDLGSQESDTLFDLGDDATMLLHENKEEALLTTLMVPPSPSGTWQSAFQQDPAATPPKPPSTAHLTLQGLDPQTRTQRVLQLMRRLCISLGYLHGQGLVHCDLKPGNILIRDDQWPILIDFGLLMQFAGRTGRESVDTQRSGQGTPLYMSPEQLRGSLLDARTDLYSLGCILYELLTGRPPFIGTQEEIKNQHLSSLPTPPSHLGESLPPAIDQIVLRLLAKKPQERIGYTDTLRHMLGKLVPPDVSVPQDWKGTIDAPAQYYLYRPGFVSRPALLAPMEALIAQMSPVASGPNAQPDTNTKLWLLEGESGVGKTRMFLELARLGAEKGRQVLTGECMDHHSPPLEGFLPFLRALALRGQTSGEQDIHQLMGPLGRALLAYEPLLSQMPGVAQLPALPELPPNQMRDIVHQALYYALSNYAQEHNVLLLIDDLQWADALTLGFLHYIEEAPPLPQVLLIGAYRIEERNESLGRLRSHATASCLVLERFNEEGVGLLVKDMLALPSSPRKFSQFLARHSEGNPFFVAEYLRAAVESGLLWRHPQGRWHIGTQGLATDLDPDEESLPLPDSLRALVAHRLQELTPHATALLAAAAIVDREITYAMLVTLTQLSQDQLWDALEELQRKQILLTSPENTLRFAHDKIREVAYASLQEETRRSLHYHTAVALEAEVEQQQGSRLAALATHWQHAGEHSRALHYYQQAAQLAERQHNNEEAIRLYRAFIQLDQQTSSETIHIYLAMGKVQRLIGEVEAAETTFKQSWALARQLQLPDLEGQSQSALGILYSVTGRSQECSQAHQSALAVYQRIGNRALEGATLGDLATHYFADGQPHLAQRMFIDALTIHYETHNYQAQAKDLANLAGIYIQLNELHTARKLYETALALVERFGPERYYPQILNNFAHIYQYQNNFAKAKQLYQQTYTMAIAQGNRRTAGMALGNLGVILRDEGQIEEARSTFQQAIQIHRDVGNLMFEVADWIQQLVMDRLCGQHLLALKASLHTIEVMLRNASDSPHMAMLLCELGHIELAQGFDAQDRLIAAEKLAKQAHIRSDSPTEVAVAITRLSLAQDAARRQEPLYRGQRRNEIPQGLLSRLQRDGHIPPDGESSFP